MSKSALKLFKQAGIGDYIMQGLQGQGSTAQNYLTRGGAGALAGGLGMGLSSYMGSEDDDPHKIRNALAGGMTGAALGGGLGLGANAIQDFMNPKSGMPPRMQQLQDQAASKGEQLDTNPFGYNHPIGQTGINLTHGSPAAAAGIGAGAGIGLGQYRDSKGVAAISQRMKDANIPRNTTAYTDFLSQIKEDHTDAHKKLWVENQANNNPDFDIGRIKEHEADLGLNTKPGWAEGLRRDMDLNRGTYHNRMGPLTSGQNAMEKLKASLTAAGGHFPGGLGSAKRGLGRAAGRGLTGAGVALGGEFAGRGLMDSYMNMKYSPEQLEAWNSGGA